MALTDQEDDNSEFYLTYLALTVTLWGVHCVGWRENCFVTAPIYGLEKNDHNWYN